jgi:hypothetical protein
LPDQSNPVAQLAFFATVRAGNGAWALKVDVVVPFIFRWLSENRCELPLEEWGTAALAEKLFQDAAREGIGPKEVIDGLGFADFIVGKIASGSQRLN